MPGPIESRLFEAPPGRWRFARAAPAPALADVVVEYWEVEGSLAPFRERILPNGRAELMLNLGPSHRMVTAAGTTVWERAWFSGVHERAIVIESDQGTHLVSARLHPLGVLRLFGDVPGRVNAVTDLASVLGEAACALRAAVAEAPTVAERFAQLEDFLLARLETGVRPSPVVSAAVRRIEAAHGALRITDLPAELGLSRKQLWLRFRRETGLSPKAYARLWRFVWTLERLQASETADWPRLAAAAGYADQSHLVRDFRRIAAASPTTFLRTRTPDGTALLDAAG